MFTDGLRYEIDEDPPDKHSTDKKRRKDGRAPLKQLRSPIEAGYGGQIRSITPDLANVIDRRALPGAMTTLEAANYFRVSTKTFLKHYSPLLSPIPTSCQNARRKHRRWSRFEIERLAANSSASGQQDRQLAEDSTFIRAQMEKRLE